MIGQLNRWGYAVASGVALAGLGALFYKEWRDEKTRFHGKFRWRRFERAAPLIFLIMAVRSFVGGALYPPNNWDSLMYRIPRVLHWLAMGKWHWIHTIDLRFNAAGCVWEWVSAPLILLFNTDRELYLTNVISFILLPGLVFSLFRRLGVSGRVAWWWMWLLPSGWCFALQAGSTGNDLFAATFALASVELALRARESGRVTDWWLSFLSVALLTGVKPTNLPLVLPWMIAAFGGCRLLRMRPVGSGVILVIGVLASLVPTMYLNHEHMGSFIGFAPNWAGQNVEVSTNYQINSPVWGIIGNAFAIPLANFAPPFFPWSNKWGVVMAHFQQTPFGSHFTGFESLGKIGTGTTEMNAGLGLALSLFVCLTAADVFFGGRAIGGVTQEEKTDGSIRLLRLAPWLCLLVFMAKVGVWEIGRLLCPYYMLLFPSLLVLPGNRQLVQKGWWKMGALLVMASAVALLVICPARPLLPLGTAAEKLHDRYPNVSAIGQLSDVYSSRLDLIIAKQPFGESLPSGEQVVGYATTLGVAEVGLWRPFGQRRVERIVPGDTLEDLRSRGIHFVMVDDMILVAHHETIEQWAAPYHGIIVVRQPIKMAGYPDAHLFLVRLGEPAASSQ
ncbi:MAG: hypothetical protein ACLQSR_01485 [Limisphaerales bacterium]